MRLNFYFWIAKNLGIFVQKTAILQVHFVERDFFSASFEKCQVQLVSHYAFWRFNFFFMITLAVRGMTYFQVTCSMHVFSLLFKQKDRYFWSKRHENSVLQIQILCRVRSHRYVQSINMKREQSLIVST